jgi:viologen exporter family transport system permease protein
VYPDLATVAPDAGRPSAWRIPAIWALAAAGFRRYATYRQAMIAATFTNMIFGLMRTYILLAAAAGAGGVAAGYAPDQLVTYCWLGQGLIGTVMLWGWTELGDRIRTGDVVADLLRPIHPVISYLAVDLGRAGYAALTRFAVPILVGGLLFDLYLPRRALSYPLFLLSTVLAVVVCFGCRYLVNTTAFWLLDMRGIGLVWTFCSGVLTGLVFPLHFLPGWVVVLLWLATPLPSVIQAPLDVAVERDPIAGQLGLIGIQAAWAAILIALCVHVQRRAERRMVIQGG